MIPCVGDYNCPGEMKCCSGAPAIQPMFQGSGSVSMSKEEKDKYIHPVHGFCVEPRKEMGTTTSAPTQEEAHE